MTEKKKRLSPTLAMRFNDADLSDLRELSEALNRSQTDVMRVLVREARRNLPELKARAMSHPLTKARPSLATSQRPRK
jgi:hypothetical protein